SNQRIKSELGVELAYPTYREGLAALLAEETG
ncbi:MAG: SDR family NAD(P)-dependent oxidoreductase, partial [Alphaproteobacteria bacterium]|nr:SDR family NAD(P)-dependent oxidoreductase [Alphaproteobacteria bacterium]